MFLIRIKAKQTSTDFSSQTFLKTCNEIEFIKDQLKIDWTWLHGINKLRCCIHCSDIRKLIFYFQQFSFNLVIKFLKSLLLQHNDNNWTIKGYFVKVLINIFKTFNHYFNQQSCLSKYWYSSDLIIGRLYNIYCYKQKHRICQLSAHMKYKILHLLLPSRTR